MHPHTAFLYTEQQKRLADDGGYDTFANVFAQQARMVVVVLRDGWGDRGFTHIESNAIKRRINRVGAGFLFVVVADADPRPTVPDWLAPDHIYWDLPTFGIDDAADAIRQRLRRVEGAPKVETAGELATRQQRERRAESDREIFRQMDGPEAAAPNSLSLTV